MASTRPLEATAEASTLAASEAATEPSAPPTMGAAAPARPARRGRGTRGRARQVAADYLDMAKPRVQTLLLYTTVTSMYVAGDPTIGRVALTCLGGALAAGGAGAINHYLDRDLDALMERTADRPLPSGRVAPSSALTYGVVLGAASFALLGLAVNLLAAMLALAGLLGYVLVYTLWLKRTTPHNIVIGGAAGAMPPLVAWAATTGSLSPDAVYLFAIVFLWTPPHFWALSLLMIDEYAKAGVPMLPVVRGEAETRRQIVRYAIALVAASLLPVASGLLGIAYLLLALALGTGFVGLAVRLRRRADRATALRTFLFSSLYLALLFAAMVLDARFI